MDADVASKKNTGCSRQEDSGDKEDCGGCSLALRRRNHLTTCQRKCDTTRCFIDVTKHDCNFETENLILESGDEVPEVFTNSNNERSAIIAAATFGCDQDGVEDDTMTNKDEEGDDGCRRQSSEMVGCSSAADYVHASSLTRGTCCGRTGHRANDGRKPFEADGNRKSTLPSIDISCCNASRTGDGACASSGKPEGGCCGNDSPNGQMTESEHDSATGEDRGEHRHSMNASTKAASVATPSSAFASAPNICVGVVKRNGCEVDIYDVNGRAVTFSLKPAGDDSNVLNCYTNNNSDTQAKICFSSHGFAQDDDCGIDGYMTPCFDSLGLHGDQEETCFCGIDTPHLHAHAYDPIRCNAEGDVHSGNAVATKRFTSRKKKKAGFRDLSHLAQLTLHPISNSGSTCNGAVENTDVMDCSSKAIPSVGNTAKYAENNNELVYRCCYGDEEHGEKCEDEDANCSDCDIFCKDEHSTNDTCISSSSSTPSNDDNINAIGTAYDKVDSGETKEVPYQQSCYKKINKRKCARHRRKCSVCKSSEDLLRKGADAQNVAADAGVTPRVCNSKEFARLVKNRVGFRGDRLRQMFQIKHDEHFDYLVHDNGTGNLHLEHPCNTCGDFDYHGKLRLVGRRSWAPEYGGDLGRENRINLHFFETSPASQNLLDLFADFFSTDTSRVAAVRCCASGNCSHQHRTAADNEDESAHHHHNHGYDVPQNGHRLGRSPTHRGHSACIGSFYARDNAVAVVTKERCQPIEDCCRNSTMVDEEGCDAAQFHGMGTEELPMCCADGVSCCGSHKKEHTENFCREVPFAPLLFTYDKKQVRKSIETHVPSSFVVRSTFHVTNVCCSSEVPGVQLILSKLPGVNFIALNTTTKILYVDHDYNRTTAENIAKKLKHGGFGATLVSDGKSDTVVDTISSVGQSQFRVENICCASEVPAIKSILEPLHGVIKVAVNVTLKIAYVDHDVNLTSAKVISDILLREGFPARVARDAAVEKALSTAALGSKSYVESTIGITNLFDQDGVAHLTSVLLAHDRICLRNYNIHPASKTVKLDHNPEMLSATAIVDGFLSSGIDATLITDGFAEERWSNLKDGEDVDDIEQQNATLEPHIILSGVFWVISLLSYIGGNWIYLKYVALLSVAFGLPKITSKAYRTLRRRQFDANCMMLSAALGAVALQDFVEGAAVTFLFAISEWLESISTSRARNALANIVNLKPERANLLDPTTNNFVLVAASAVPVGSIVSVKTGDKIPCDGTVEEGMSAVDESSLTGESRPVKRNPGDPVSGGTINCGVGQLLVRTSSTVENSAVARLIKLVQEAQANRSPTEMLIDSFSKRYTPIVIIMAVLMCTIPWAFGRDVGRKWTMIGLVLIVIACPCALIISTPVTYVAGLAAAAQNGVLVKGGAHLEALGRVRRIAFDKTGTLTEGQFALLHLIVTREDVNRSHVLAYLARVEVLSSHPLGAALVSAAKVEVPGWETAGGDVQNHTILEGEGVTASVDGKNVHIGNHRLFERLNLLDDVPLNVKDVAAEWVNDGGTVGFMSIEGFGIVCCYSVSDKVRSEAENALSRLSDLGIHVCMLTGDNRSAALCIAKQVGLSEINVKSNLLPGDKLALIAELKASRRNTFFIPRFLRCEQNGLVLMCGDGVNDAPALAGADVGASMGAGAALAMETSDVTLMDSNLNKLVEAVILGRRTIRTIKQNVMLSLAAKIVVVGFTFAGYTTLWLAIASDVGAMLVVTLNGMTLLPSEKSLFKRILKEAERAGIDSNQESV